MAQKEQETQEDIMEKYIAKLSAASDVRMEKYLAGLSAESDARLEHILKESDIKMEKEREIFREDIERYIGGLTEDFQAKIDTVIEQFDSINNKLDQIPKKADQSDFIALEQRVSTLELEVLA